jgi:dihydropteroate synthase
MGVLNATPDSFSDGGLHLAVDRAVAAAERMAGEGADIIDVGGETTRPGAEAIPAEAETRRIVPVIEALRRRIGLPISVDTSKPEVMRAAVAAGAGMINDVRALAMPGAMEAAREAQVPICLMHMQGEPRTMQAAPHYADVVREVGDFLLRRAAACQSAGIDRSLLLVDPGFGFGKDLTHNLELLRGLDRLAGLGFPLVVGVSRKSFVGTLTGKPVGDRMPGSVGMAVFAMLHGAAVLRVHDVGPTVDAIRAVEAIVKGTTA